MAADLEDGYHHFLDQGCDEAEAIRRAEEAFGTSDETLSLLARIHNSGFGSVAERISQQIGTLWARLLLALLLAFEILLAGKILTDPWFLRYPSPFLLPIVLLALVILGLVVKNSIALLSRRQQPAARRRQSIDAVLFWGGVAALLGFLGQWTGINKMTQAVARAGIVSPQAIAIGVSESLLTPIAGMAVLVVSACLWFLLRIGHWSQEQRS